jgi:hypothetical protein
MMLVDEPARIFQVWAYTVGMGRLLLRSPKGEGCATRVDVLFQNVKAMKLATSLPGLAVTEADPEQQQRIVKATGLLPDDLTHFYVLTGVSYEGYVVAGVCARLEDEGEYFEPSKLWPER